MLLVLCHSLSRLQKVLSAHENISKPVSSSSSSRLYDNSPCVIPYKRQHTHLQLDLTISGGEESRTHVRTVHPLSAYPKPISTLTRRWIRHTRVTASARHTHSSPGQELVVVCQPRKTSSLTSTSPTRPSTLGLIPAPDPSPLKDSRRRHISVQPSHNHQAFFRHESRNSSSLLVCFHQKEPPTRSGLQQNPRIERRRFSA